MFQKNSIELQYAFEYRKGNVFIKICWEINFFLLLFFMDLDDLLEKLINETNSIIDSIVRAGSMRNACPMNLCTEIIFCWTLRVLLASSVRKISLDWVRNRLGNETLEVARLQNGHCSATQRINDATGRGLRTLTVLEHRITFLSELPSMQTVCRGQMCEL